MRRTVFGFHAVDSPIAVLGHLKDHLALPSAAGWEK